MFEQQFIKNLYGFLVLNDISNNKEVLYKELDFINQSINNLSKLALSATGLIIGSVFLYKDEILSIFEISMKALITFELLSVLIVYLVIYISEMGYKNSYKKEIIKKIKELKLENKESKK